MPATVPNVSLFEDSRIAFSNKTDKELKLAYRLFQSFNNPLLLKLGTGFTNFAFQLHLPVEGIVKVTAFKQFCGGETLEGCISTIRHLGEYNIDTALTYAVETKSSEEEFDKITEELIQSIKFAANHPHVKVIACKPTAIADIELLERLQKKTANSDDDKAALERVRLRMYNICRAAMDAGIQLFFDAEETWIQNPLDELVDAMMQRFNKEKPVVYNTYQMYVQGRLSQLKSALRKAKEDNYFLGIKLVRGAYMEKERAEAEKEDRPSPIQPNKAACDADYNAALDFCVENIDRIAFCAATHNEKSCLHLADLMDKNNIPHNHPHIIFSQLYGMGEHITYNLAKAGFQTLKLVPYGSVRDAIPYLIRRAQENSSASGQVAKELVMIEKEMKRRGLR